MNKVSYLVFWCVTLLACSIFTGCIEQVQHGYPLCVEFNTDGGVKQIPGDLSPASLRIHDNNDDGETVDCSPWRNDTTAEAVCTVSYQWLTAEVVRGQRKITIRCSPNDTGKKRTLYVEGNFGDDYCDIKVIQKK